MDELFEEYRESNEFFNGQYDAEGFDALDVDHLDYDDEVDDAYEM